MQKEPPPFVWAAPDEKDILTCAPSPSHVHRTGTHSSFPGNFIIVGRLSLPLTYLRG
jgi:hypothetical protein